MAVHVDGQMLSVTLSNKPTVAITSIRLLRAVALPAHAKNRLGLSGSWAIAAGTYTVKEYRLRMPLVRTR